MGITKLKVSNFKSFDELEIELRPLNIVVGANAAGKSNFLEIFRFLHDIAESGLENAVSLQGGMGYLANLKIGASRPISVRVSSQFPGSPEQTPWSGAIEIDAWEPRVLETEYGLALQVGESRQDFEILREKITQRCELVQVGSQPARTMTGEYVIARTGLGIKSRLQLSTDAPMYDDWPTKLSHNESLVRRSGIPVFPELAFFDIDPRLSKRATPLAGRAELDQDGSNLAIVLKNIFSDSERAGRFSRLLKDLLPFVEDLRVENLADKSLLFLLRETYSGQDYLPAAFLSNGTIHLTALLLALYFDLADVTVIEEPERNLHPHLISRLVAMMADAAKTRQVVTTTHNPELVKHADLADLLLVRRDANGFSQVSRPAESTELKVFLENELGIDELYVQDLLGAGHAV